MKRLLHRYGPLLRRRWAPPGDTRRYSESKAILESAKSVSTASGGGSSGQAAKWVPPSRGVGSWTTWRSWLSRRKAENPPIFISTNAQHQLVQGKGKDEHPGPGHAWSGFSAAEASNSTMYIVLTTCIQDTTTTTRPWVGYESWALKPGIGWRELLARSSPRLIIRAFGRCRPTIGTRSFSRPCVPRFYPCLLRPEDVATWARPYGKLMEKKKRNQIGLRPVQARRVKKIRSRRYTHTQKRARTNLFHQS